MQLDLGVLLQHAGLEPATIQGIRHSFVGLHEDGTSGIHMNSTDDEILAYTRRQRADSRLFPAVPPRFWVVFIREGGDRARFWGVVENFGEESNDGFLRFFRLEISAHMSELRNRLVIKWKAPRSWRLNGETVAKYPVVEIAEANPEPFPGYENLVLNHDKLQIVMTDHRYEAWRQALSNVAGIYLITDTSSGRQYVGKADGTERIRQRWAAYAANGHGNNVQLKGLDPSHFRFSILRVFDPTIVSKVINEAENHFKVALDTRQHGLNGN